MNISNGYSLVIHIIIYYQTTAHETLLQKFITGFVFVYATRIKFESIASASAH